MTYNDFKNRVQKMPIVFSRDIMLRSGREKQVTLNQLGRWCRRGLLIKLRKGIFFLNSNDRKIMPSRVYIANQLYSPSYVSLEYALNFYDLIPESVSDLTSVSAKKTLLIKNELGQFVYRHCQPDFFRGFEALKDEEGLISFIAVPEKAIVDFIYFNLSRFKPPYEEMLKESYRFQNVDSLNPKKIISFAKLIKNNKLLKVARAFCCLIEE